MSGIQLTEADIGKLFKLRNDETVVLGHNANPVEDHYIAKAGIWYYDENGKVFAEEEHDLDIIERLDQKTIEEVISLDADNPQSTFAGSDGKQYPAEWFAVQQRFDEHTPPEYAQLRIESFEGAPIGRAVFDNNFLTVGYEDSTQQVHLDQIYDQWTWTIASAPPKPKPVPNIWDEYKTPCGKGVLPEFGEPIFENTIRNNPKRYKAVSEYILHNLSQGEELE